MKITRYGIELEKLRFEDLETVRHWRNSPFVRDSMEFQEKITPGLHAEWFKKIDNPNNFYFVISLGGQKIGIVNTKNIDWSRKTGEAGMFVGDPDYRNSISPVLAVLVMMDFMFLFFGLETLYAKIRCDHQHNIEFNKRLGYQRLEGEERKDFPVYRVTRERYFSFALPLREAAMQIGGNRSVLFFDAETEPWIKPFKMRLSPEAGLSLRLSYINKKIGNHLND